MTIVLDAGKTASGRVVEQIVTGTVAGRVLDEASAERVPSSFTSRRRQKRESDIIWRFRRKDNGEPVYVYILLEFQSRPDHYMAVRLMTYIGLFFEYLIAQGLLPKSGKLPLVIPVVVYNGIGPWGPALELAELIERLDDPSADQSVPRDLSPSGAVVRGDPRAAEPGRSDNHVGGTHRRMEPEAR